MVTTQNQSPIEKERNLRQVISNILLHLESKGLSLNEAILYDQRVLYYKGKFNQY